MNSNNTANVLLPFWGLGGGVLKLIDHAEHLLESFDNLRLWGPPIPSDDDLVFTVPAVQRVLDNARVRVDPIERFDPEPTDWVLFTEPGHHRLADRPRSPAAASRLIQLVQGVVHADPTWNGGLHRRVLTRPASRIWISPAVEAACAPIANQRCPATMILQGHDVDFFAGARDRAGSTRMRVGHAPWKSDLGDRVAERLRDDTRVEFVAAGSPIGWPALRDFYQSIDVFLATPLAAEGFHLPGLEALAAGCALVAPEVGGNSCYLRHESNALVVGHESVDDAVAAVERLAANPDLRRRLASTGKADVAAHRLERERVESAAFIASIRAMSSPD